MDVLPGTCLSSRHCNQPFLYELLSTVRFSLQINHVLTSVLTFLTVPLVASLAGNRTNFLHQKLVILLRFPTEPIHSGFQRLQSYCEISTTVQMNNDFLGPDPVLKKLQDTCALWYLKTLTFDHSSAYSRNWIYSSSPVHDVLTLFTMEGEERSTLCPRQTLLFVVRTSGILRN